jgi:hypothetical protein
MLRGRATLFSCAAIAATLLAARTAAASANCDIFEAGFMCVPLQFEMPFCNSAGGFTGEDSDDFVLDNCDGIPVPNCTGSFSCSEDPNPPFEYEDEFVEESNPPVIFAARYFVGDKVAYKGKQYVCRKDHTAKKKSNPTQDYSRWARVGVGNGWAVQVIYIKSQIIGYKGKRYAALSSHQAKKGLEPDKSKSKWKRVP